MNNKVKFLRGTATEYEASTKDNDTFYYTTDDGKLYLGNKEITNGGVTIDDTLSDTSKNPVQNKVINAALNSKANLSDIPTTLPANGGNAETVGGKSAGEFVQCIGKITTSEIVDDPNYPIAYECSISPGTAQEIGLSGGWYHLKYFKHPDSGDIGWGAQIVLPLNNSTLKPMYRFARNTSEDWGTWHNFADGGNADTVDGKHAADFSQNLGYWRDEKSIKEYVAGVNTSGFCIISSQVADMPVAGAAWMGIINCSNGSKQITVYKVSDSKPCAYSMIYFAPSDVWYDWVCLSDGGNASTANTASTLATTSSNICLRNLSSGTAEATWNTATGTGNCPVGAWYGKHS